MVKQINIMSGEHFLLLSPSKKKQLSQINPEFVGIAKQLGKSHLSKNHAKNQRNTISNRLSYLQKQENQAEKKLSKKQKQLEMLMNTIARKQADLQWKEAQRRAKEEAIAQQRQLNLKRRNMRQQRIRESFLQLYDENHQNSKNLRNTQRLHQSMLKTMHRGTLHQKQQMVIRGNMAHEQGRKRLASYFKQKNDLFTSRYKEHIKMEEQQAKLQLQYANKLTSLSGEAKLRLQKSTAKIEEISMEIKQTANQSKNLSLSRHLKWSNLSKKNNYSETKTDSCKQADLKLDKFIQKELSLNETELSKI